MTGRSFAFYSYTCFNQEFNPRTSALTSAARREAVLGKQWLDTVPIVDLPVPLHIIHHRQEKLGKSTGCHALVLAPTTTIHHFPDLPEFDTSQAALLFPSEDAKPQEAMSDKEFMAVKHFYVIDSTWQQARAIQTDPRLDGIRRITIKPQKTKFWRYQNIGAQCLSSIEAIYYMYKEYLLRKNAEYHGEVDNLLFYFCFFYEKIQESYTKGKFAKEGKTFTKKHPGMSYIHIQRKS